MFEHQKIQQPLESRRHNAGFIPDEDIGPLFNMVTVLHVEQQRRFLELYL
jgi:hypothetical protein